MKRLVACPLAVLVTLALLLGAAPGAAGAGLDAPGAGAAVSLLDHLTEPGSPVRLGFGVAPLRGSLADTPAPVPGVQEGETATVVTFDLNLAWPLAGRGVLEPYVVLGPALFVVEPDSAGRLLGTRLDPTVRLGARAGAGLNWRVGKHATLFGGYEFTTEAPGGVVSSGSRGLADSGVSGYDITYGLRFLY